MFVEKTKIGQFCSMFIKVTLLNNNFSSLEFNYENENISSPSSSSSLFTIESQEIDSSSAENSLKTSNSSDSLINNPYIKLICDNYYFLNNKIGDNAQLSSFGTNNSTGDAFKLTLIKYTYPIILIFGLFGNVISFIVMLRIYNKRKNFLNFSLSLATLALADIVVLIFGCLREYLDDVHNFSLKSSSAYSCKIILFTCYLFSCFSAYLHSYIALERWHAITYPIKSKTKFTFRINKIIMFTIFLICFAFNMPLLWFSTIKQLILLDNSDSLGLKIVDECDIIVSSGDYFISNLILVSIDSLFYCLIPFIITIMFSGLTLIRLINNSSTSTSAVFKSSKSVSSTSNNRNVSLRIHKETQRISIRSKREKFKSNQVTVETDSLGSSELPNTDSIRTKFKKQRIEIQKSSSRSKSSNLKTTVMLMALPISYLITTFPIFIISIHGWILSNFRTNKRGNMFRDEEYDYATFYSIAKMLMYINNSINILFYIVFGKSLRNDFIAILPIRRCIQFHKENLCQELVSIIKFIKIEYKLIQRLRDFP